MPTQNTSFQCLVKITTRHSSLALQKQKEKQTSPYSPFPAFSSSRKLSTLLTPKLVCVKQLNCDWESKQTDRWTAGDLSLYSLTDEPAKLKPIKCLAIYILPHQFLSMLHCSFASNVTYYHFHNLCYLMEYNVRFVLPIKWARLNFLIQMWWLSTLLLIYLLRA